MKQIVFYKCRGKKVNGITEPEIPHLKNSMVINEYSKQLNEFICQITADSLEHRKLKNIDGVERIRTLVDINDLVEEIDNIKELLKERTKEK